MGPSDKIQIIDFPALPSSCRVCNRSADGRLKFIDFGLSFDVDGSVNFCVDCVVNMGQAVGMVPVAELDNVVREASMALQMLESLQQENEQLRDSLDTLSRFSINAVSDGNRSDAFSIQLVPAGNGAIGEGNRIAGRDYPVAPESYAGRGLEDVSLPGDDTDSNT